MTFFDLFDVALVDEGQSFFGVESVNVDAVEIAEELLVDAESESLVRGIVWALEVRRGDMVMAGI